MKYFGYRTLFSLANTAFFCWIISRDTSSIYIPVVVISLLLAIFFVPIVSVSKERIKVLSFNPFAKRINLPVSDIAAIKVHAGDIRFKMSFTLKNGEALTGHSMLRYYDMENLYNALRDTGVEVTSTGVRAITWKS